MLFLVMGTATSAQDSVPLARTASSDRFGTILVDVNGMALYQFSADQAGASSCSSACAEAWPLAVFQKGATPISVPIELEVTAVPTSDGRMMLAWRGMPLYRFAQDAAPGDVRGDGITSFGGTWKVVVPSPPVVEAPPAD